MKLFGKKTLAMLLTIVMAMSICCVSTYAADDNVTGDVPLVPPVAPGPVAVTGVSVDANKAITFGKTATLTAVVAPAEATNKSVTWESSDPSVADVSSTGVVTAKKVGTAIITVKTVDGNFTDTCAVTVNKAYIKSASATTAAVPYGAAESVVKAKLPSSIEITYTDDTKQTLPVGSTYLGNWTGTYNASATTHTYTAVLSANDNCELLPGVNVTVTVPTTTNWNLGNDIPVTGVVEGDDDVIYDLDEAVRDAIVLALGKSISTPDVNFGSATYGVINDADGTYTTDLTSTQEDNLFNAGYLTDSNISFTTTVAGVNYEGKIDITMYTADAGDSFTYAGGTLSAIANRIKAVVEAQTGYDMEAIEFESMEMDGGILWENDTYEEEVYDDTYYTPSELAAMIYMPDGSGETSYLSYVAYTDYDADDDEVDEYSDYVEGVIRLYSDEFLLLTTEITDDDVLDFDGEELLDAVYNWDDNFETKYVKFISIPNAATAGYLYHEYDEDDNSNTKVTSSKSYYVEPTGSQTELTDFTYVPGDSTSGMITIVFRAYKSTSNYITGVIQINVIEVADITINAGKGQTVDIDPELFQEFIEDVDTSNKTLEIVSVAISGAPYKSKTGYLITDGEELDKSGTKTFYADEDDVDVDDKKYDLFDLSFEGGSTDNTTNATFKVTYLRKGSSTKRYAEGTIDFVVGAAAAGNTMNGTIQASKTMNFGETITLNAFEELGSNDNEYITFTSLPTGGKLVYNWGKSGQEDVQVGTEYYLSYKAGKKLMSNVTFVPSYSSIKVQKPVTIGVKGFNAKGRATTGTINITINYASISSQFTDITNSTYADSVDFLYNQGITTGMTATTFGPNSNVTRAQFVTFLWRAAGSPVVTGVTNKFTDVKSTGTYAYAYQAILWAVQNNITTGRTATTFDPAANVSHQELLTFLYRYDVNYLKHSATTSSYVNYTDYASVSEYAQIPVKWADYKGILDGYAIHPTVAGTRATVALWLHRMLTL